MRDGAYRMVGCIFTICSFSAESDGDCPYGGCVAIMRFSQMWAGHFIGIIRTKLL